MEISHKQLNKNFANMVSDTIALEASDVLKIQAGSANQITGTISYALIDRSQENG